MSISGIVNAMFSVDRDPYSLGDTNGDGRINAIDYARIKQTVLGEYTPTAQQLVAMDINKDGKVNALDYMLAKRHVMRLYCIPLG